ncbi:MAG TPA: hypothetical protein VGD79_09510 [Thermoanaerobaculia bacterium]
MPDFALLFWILGMLVGLTEPRQPSTANRQTPVDFTRDVRPILEQRCQPCHFDGGKMYAKLPFDKPETVHKLGEKLFTRIKTEDDRRVIRAFLAQRP